MTILFDSSAIVSPANFGVGLEDAIPPAIAAKAPRHPSTADQLYWQAYQLGLDGEDPATPGGLTLVDLDSWTKGLTDGRAVASRAFDPWVVSRIVDGWAWDRIMRLRPGLTESDIRASLVAFTAVQLDDAAWASYLEYRDRERMLEAMEAGHADQPHWAYEGPYDMPRGFSGHDAYEG